MSHIPMWLERAGRVLWNGRDRRGHYDTIERVSDAELGGDPPPLCPHACCGGKRAHPPGQPVIKRRKAKADRRSIRDKALNKIAAVWGSDYEPWKPRAAATGATKRRADSFGRQADYGGYLASRYDNAVEATNGYMVNAAGKAKGYQSSDFFRAGRRPSVDRWGTEELKAWMGSEHAAAHGSKLRVVGVMSKTDFEQSSAARRHHLNNPT